MTIHELARRGVSGRQIAGHSGSHGGARFGITGAAAPRAPSMAVRGRPFWPVAGTTRWPTGRRRARAARRRSTWSCCRVVGAGGRLSPQPAVAAALRARAVSEAPAAGASAGRNPVGGSTECQTENLATASPGAPSVFRSPEVRPLATFRSPSITVQHSPALGYPMSQVPPGRRHPIPLSTTDTLVPFRRQQPPSHPPLLADVGS